MMHILPCHQVREDLQACHDGELPVESRVQIQNHLHECVACRLEAASLADLGDALRTMAAAVPGRTMAETGIVTGAVIERIRVEQQYSLVSQFRNLFDDMHLVWAGLGASMALVVCVVASAGVLQAASQETLGFSGRHHQHDRQWRQRPGASVGHVTRKHRAARYDRSHARG